MKLKFFAILLFLSIVIPFGTTFLLIEYQKKQVRRELKSRLLLGVDKQELVLLKFKTTETKNKVHWEKDDEFSYKDEFYDVVEEKIVGDSHFFWCWWDNEDTKLSKRLSTLLDLNFSSNPIKQDNQKRLNQFLETFYVATNNSKPLLIWIIDQKVYNKVYQNFYNSWELSPPSPPPKLV